jgi:hypothetical protein
VKVPMLLAQVEANDAMTEDGSGSLGAELQRLSIYCDQSFAFYDAIVESASDESMMRTAQTLTSSALDRIGILNRLTRAG